MSLCTECETVVEDGDDLICAGGCRRHFHPECTARADCRHLARHENSWCLPSASSASRRKGDDVVAWRCYECELSVKRCAICKQFSLGASRGRATTAICVTCPPPKPPPKSPCAPRGGVARVERVLVRAGELCQSPLFGSFATHHPTPTWPARRACAPITGWWCGVLTDHRTSLHLRGRLASCDGGNGGDRGTAAVIVGPSSCDGGWRW